MTKQCRLILQKLLEVSHDFFFANAPNICIDYHKIVFVFISDSPFFDWSQQAG